MVVFVSRNILVNSVSITSSVNKFQVHTSVYSKALDEGNVFTA